MARLRPRADRQPAERTTFRTPVLSWRHFALALGSGAAALAVAVVASTLGNVHGSSEDKLFAYLGALVFVVLAVVAVRSCATTLASAVPARPGRSGRSGATVIKVLVSFIGYVVVLFVALGLIGVSATRLLIGGALTGVVIGIAAQQPLGNVFAGLVLLLARPFSVDQRVRVRSGTLGGNFEGVVLSMNLAYVTIQTNDGVVHVPNSAMLAAGVGPAPPISRVPAPGASPPSGPPGEPG